MSQLTGKRPGLIIMDEEFTPSPEILVLQTKSSYRLTRHPRHEDYCVWDGARIIAQGGMFLMQRVFQELPA